MNLKHAQYVLTILREGGVTAAARKLYVSQPSLSQTVKQIESNLGAPIFTRDGDALSLTYAGQLYVEAAKKVLAINENLVHEIADIRHETRGRMRLGISRQRGMNLLPLVVPAFLEKYPHVQLELEEHGSDKLEQMVQDGLCDIAFVTTYPEKALEYVLIENEQLVLMASNSTAIAQRHMDGAEIDISEAADEQFVSLKEGHSVRVVQDKLFALNNINPCMLLESDSFETAKHIAARARAVMITPYVYIANVPTLREHVKCFPIRNLGYIRHFYLCHRKGLYFTRYMKDFVQLVRENSRAYRIDLPTP